MTCKHENFETVGKFPKNLYIHEDHGDNDRLANKIKCLDCGIIGIEKYSFIEGNIEHSEKCECSEYDMMGKFPNNMFIDGEYFANKIKCYFCRKIGKEFYEFEKRTWC